MKAKSGSRSTAPLNQPWQQVEVSGQLHTLPALASRKDPSTDTIGGWVGPKAGLDGFGEEKISYPFQYSNPRPYYYYNCYFIFAKTLLPK